MLKIEVINALFELDSIGWDYKEVGNYEVKCKCPHPEHDDNEPSCQLNVQKNQWYCQSCGAKGDIITFLCHITQASRGTTLADLQTRYELNHKKTIKMDLVEKFHEQIWKQPNSLQELYDRGLTDSLLRKHRIGFDKNVNRITIPIYDKTKQIVNIRKYKPGAPGPEKFRNMRGYSTLEIYLPEQLGYDTLWICGGELKALAATPYLNKLGIGAVAVTGGEGTWHEKFNASVRDKILYVCNDIDAKGISSSRKLAGLLAYSATVYIVHLPLDKEEFPKGDLNDWIALGKPDFVKAMDTAERFIAPAIGDDNADDDEANEVKLVESTQADNMGRRIAFDGICSASDTTPYIVPREIGCSCTRDQPNCDHCPIRIVDPDEKTGKVTLRVRGVSAGILEMVGAPKKTQREAIREALRIPNCKSITFTIRSHFNVLDVRLTPQLSVNGDNSEHVTQQALVVGRSELELNTPYRFEGRVYPHPKTQQAVLLLDTVADAEDNLTSYTPSDEELAELKIFQPKEWTCEAIEETLDNYYDGIARNVTRIFDRSNLHLGIDLAYHSVLHFRMDSRIHNGWVNALVVGDSAQGKSETSIRLMEHYGLGVRHDCKNASVAGLIGGLQQLGTRWFVSWGTLPANDRRLVHMEEIKGMHEDIIGKLTDLRSSGVAEITKIEQRRAHARTRLLMYSNPRSNRSVSTYNFGIEVIKELVSALEDIRRFDFALVLGSKQVLVERINQLSGIPADQVNPYGRDLCRHRVLWAWTRTPEEVTIGNDTAESCRRLSTELCDKFTETVPLIDRGTTRLKLARLATSLAAITFSVDEDPHVIIVRPCHVEYIAKWLDEQYSNPCFGYADFSKAMEYGNTLLDPKLLEKRISASKYPKDLVESMLYTDTLKLDDFLDWCDIDREGARSFVSFLVRKHAIQRKGRVYIKTDKFIQLLKEIRPRMAEHETELDKELF